MAIFKTILLFTKREKKDQTWLKTLKCIYKSYIFHICIKKIWDWITQNGWYAIKSNQTNQTQPNQTNQTKPNQTNLRNIKIL